MARIVRARYENGVLKPLEKLDLREGEEVIVRVEKKVAHGLVELIKKLREETPKVDNPIEVLEEMRK
ncbi:MAG: antitoxin family protein [Thermoprotei archaeon]|nr:antitoxin family protein [Thermoprotei archaeon]